MFLKIRAAHLKTPWLLRVMTWVAISLMSSGIISNSLVKLANEGKMPVAMQKADILFVIGPAQLGVNYFSTVEDFDQRHRELTQNSRLRILADRIPISFRFIHPSKLPRWCYRVLNHMQISAGEDGIASIGDLLIWPGILVALPTILVLMIYLVWGICRKFKRKT